MDHEPSAGTEAGRCAAAPAEALPPCAATAPAVAGPLAGVRYVLPLKWVDNTGLEDLAGYLAAVVAWLPVTVVDGSSEELFAAHRRSFPEAVEHVRPDAWPGRNGKVAGVMTGVRRAREERIVVADDDVRHTRRTLERIVALLGEAEVVRPQNYYLDLPWHARWDTGRILLNRALGGDWPGTLGLRRSALLAAGGYDGDVLFENLELVRTVRADGGREHVALDVLVGRIPPTVHHFLGQRIRQAYDDFAQPSRLLLELSLLPLGALAGKRPTLLAAAVVAVCGLAELGRRRSGGSCFFPAGTVLWAPLWAFERAVCVWAAVVARMRGGVPYAGSRLRTAGHSVAALRRRERRPNLPGGATPVQDRSAQRWWAGAPVVRGRNTGSTTTGTA